MRLGKQDLPEGYTMKRKSITMLMTDKDGYVTSREFNDWEDIEIRISLFREGTMITFEENWEEDE